MGDMTFYNFRKIISHLIGL